MQTKAEIAEYMHNYYLQHQKERKVFYANNKKRCMELHYLWRAKNPEQFANGQQAWRKKNPEYHRQYAKKRVDVVDPLAFQYLDNRDFGKDFAEFIQYLRSQDVSEQHINWFKKDVQKCIGDVAT